ncbi:MAG TPA: hypothetical protein VHY32_02280 [Caulobacteraceae bacterium]|nr:hypothetical protein [Caulobacteraceae bacterium]
MGQDTRIGDPSAPGFGEVRFETLLCDIPRPGVARITLNRPQAMNAYDFTMCGELQAAIVAFRDDDDLCALPNRPILCWSRESP